MSTAPIEHETPGTYHARAFACPGCSRERFGNPAGVCPWPDCRYYNAAAPEPAPIPAPNPAAVIAGGFAAAGLPCQPGDAADVYTYTSAASGRYVSAVHYPDGTVDVWAGFDRDGPPAHTETGLPADPAAIGRAIERAAAAIRGAEPAPAAPIPAPEPPRYHAPGGFVTIGAVDVYGFNGRDNPPPAAAAGRNGIVIPGTCVDVFAADAAGFHGDHVESAAVDDRDAWDALVARFPGHAFAVCYRVQMFGAGRRAAPVYDIMDHEIAD